MASPSRSSVPFPKASNAACSGFLWRILVFAGFGRLLPQFDNPSQFVFVVQHVVAVSNLSAVFMLEVNLLPGLVWLSEKLRRETSPVSFRLGHRCARQLAERWKKIGEINQVIALASRLDVAGPAHHERNVGASVGQSAFAAAETFCVPPIVGQAPIRSIIRKDNQDAVVRNALLFQHLHDSPDVLVQISYHLWRILRVTSPSRPQMKPFRSPTTAAKSPVHRFRRCPPRCPPDNPRRAISSGR